MPTSSQKVYRSSPAATVAVKINNDTIQNEPNKQLGNQMIKTLCGAIFLTAISTSAFSADLTGSYSEPDNNLSDRFNWTGFYVGGNAGYGTADISIADAYVLDEPSAQDYADGFNGNADTKGGVFGAQVGYNHQFSNDVVLGGEVDLMWSGVTGSYTGYETGSGDYVADVDIDVQWMTTARMRLGYAFDRFMVYGTGGVAVIGAKAHLHRNDRQESANAHQTHVGWVAGVGAEYAIADNWTLRAEYLHLDAPDKTYRFEGIISELSSSDQQVIEAQGGGKIDYVRVGLNYRF
jgi:outer membrane immunogenic protein